MTEPLLVVATDRVSAEGLGPLADADEIELEIVNDSSSDEFRLALSRAAGLIVRSATRVDAAMIASAPALRVIGRAGVGVDNIDLAAATGAGVAVFNAPGGNTIAAAELTMALILTAMRKVAAADRSVREGKWERSAFKGGELYGRTLGLVGAGRIGAEVARRSRAFGMDVIAYDPYLPEATAAELSIRLTGFDEVIEAADVISCHVPLNDETRGLISADALGRMKATAVVVNASRGGVVDESALVEALENGSIAGAALDVYESEPLPAESPLRAAPNLVMTPHLGASTDEAQVRVAVEVAEAMARALLDGDLTGAVNRS